MKAKKPRKIDVYGPRWRQLANDLARSYAPTIYPCKKCNYPVLEGYCCTFCGTSEPR